jgi:hypothetical protein
MTGQPAESVYWTRYRQGWWEGHADGYQDGYSDGYADAMRATAPADEEPEDGERQPPSR